MLHVNLRNVELELMCVLGIWTSAVHELYFKLFKLIFYLCLMQKNIEHILTLSF